MAKAVYKTTIEFGENAIKLLGLLKEKTGLTQKELIEKAIGKLAQDRYPDEFDQIVNPPDKVPHL